jgi:hypothetical protein
MLVTMRNADLVNKLLALAGGDIDLVQAAVRILNVPPQQGGAPAPSPQINCQSRRVGGAVQTTC